MSEIRTVVKREPVAFGELIIVRAYVGRRRAGYLQSSVGEPSPRFPVAHLVLEDLEVQPEFQRLGVATLMVKAALKETGVHKVVSFMPSEEGYEFLEAFERGKRQ